MWHTSCKLDFGFWGLGSIRVTLSLSWRLQLPGAGHGVSRALTEPPAVGRAVRGQEVTKRELEEVQLGHGSIGVTRGCHKGAPLRVSPGAVTRGCHLGLPPGGATAAVTRGCHQGLPPGLSPGVSPRLSPGAATGGLTRDCHQGCHLGLSLGAVTGVSPRAVARGLTQGSHWGSHQLCHSGVSPGL